MADEPRHDLLDTADEIIKRNAREKVQIKKRAKWAELFRTIVLIIILVVILDHFHSETEQQLNAANSIVAIEKAVACPILKGQGSVHLTPERHQLIVAYCAGVVPLTEILSPATSTTSPR